MDAISVDSNTLVVQFWTAGPIPAAEKLWEWQTASYRPSVGDSVILDGTTYTVTAVRWSLREASGLLCKLTVVPV